MSTIIICINYLKEELQCRFNDYFSFEYSINSAIIVTISNPKFKLNWLSNYVEEKDMLLSIFKKYVRYIPDNEVYITAPEQSETNSDEFYVIDDNGSSTSKSTVEIEILNYINSKNTNLDMLNNYPIIKMLDDHKNPTATLQCKDMNFKYTARARKIVCYRLVTFSDVLCI